MVTKLSSEILFSQHRVFSKVEAHNIGQIREPVVANNQMVSRRLVQALPMYKILALGRGFKSRGV